MTDLLFILCIMVAAVKAEKVEVSHLCIFPKTLSACVLPFHNRSCKKTGDNFTKTKKKRNIFSRTSMEWPCTSKTPLACMQHASRWTGGGSQKQSWSTWKMWNNLPAVKWQCSPSRWMQQLIKLHIFIKLKLFLMCGKNENNYHLSV